MLVVRPARSRPPQRSAFCVGALCAWVLGGLLAGLGGCDWAQGTPPPDDRAVFPTGLAIHPDGQHLVVVSSNFDLAYDDGAVLLADLEAVRAGIDNSTAEAPEDRVATGTYVSSVAVPPFGDRPVLDENGSRLFLPTRQSNLISEIRVDAADQTLSCGDGPCGAAPFALQLTDNDPFDVRLLAEDHDDSGDLIAARGLVSSLGSGRITFFGFDGSRDDAARLRLENGVVELGEDVVSVRAATLRPATADTQRLAIVAAEFQRASTTSTAIIGGARLYWFAPAAGATPTMADLTVLTGSQGVREVMLVAGDDGENDALLVTLRAPDAIARFEIDDTTGGMEVRLAGLTSTCRGPTRMARADLATVPPVTRALVTCQDGQAIVALDPVTLDVTDAVRFFGRSPYDVVVNDRVDPPEVYVSFFLDNSIGVLGLFDEDGAPRLTIRGRIGTPLPPPEDGRE